MNQSLPLLRIYAQGHFQLGKSRFGELSNSVHNRFDTEQYLKYDIYPIRIETLCNFFFKVSYYLHSITDPLNILRYTLTDTDTHPQI